MSKEYYKERQMKTSDPAAYTYAALIVPSASTMLNIRGLLVNGTATTTITGTSYDKDSSGNNLAVSLVVQLSTYQTSMIIPISLRTISSISAGTAYGLR